MGWKVSYFLYSIFVQFALTLNRWHTLYVSTIDGVIRVLVDNEPIIALDGIIDLDMSYVGFGTTDQAAWIDNLSIWTPAPPTIAAQSSFQTFSLSEFDTYTLQQDDWITYSVQSTNTIYIFDGVQTIPLIEAGVGLASGFAYIARPIWSPDQYLLAFECSTQSANGLGIAPLTDICVAEVDENADIISITNHTNTPTLNDKLGGWDYYSSLLTFAELEQVDQRNFIPIYGGVAKVLEVYAGTVTELDIYVPDGHLLTSVYQTATEPDFDGYSQNYLYYTLQAIDRDAALTEQWGAYRLEITSYDPFTLGFYEDYLMDSSLFELNYYLVEDPNSPQYNNPMPLIHLDDANYTNFTDNLAITVSDWITFGACGPEGGSPCGSFPPEPWYQKYVYEDGYSLKFPSESLPSVIGDNATPISFTPYDGDMIYIRGDGSVASIIYRDLLESALPPDEFSLGQSFTINNNLYYADYIQSIRPSAPVEADLGLTMSVSEPDEFGEFVYTIELTNYGPNNASNVYIYGDLPFEVLSYTYHDFDDSRGYYDPFVLEWYVENIAVGETVSIDIAYRNPSGSSVTYRNVIFSLDQDDLNPLNDEASISLGSEITVSLEFDENIDPDKIFVGDEVALIAQVTNTGEVESSDNVQLIIEMPDGLVPTEVTIEQQAYNLFLQLLYLLGLISEQPAQLPSEIQFLSGANNNSIVQYNIGILEANSQNDFRLDLKLKAGIAGEYTIVGRLEVEEQIQALSLAAPIMTQQQVLSEPPTEQTRDEVLMVASSNPPTEGLEFTLNGICTLERAIETINGDIPHGTLCMGQTKAELGSSNRIIVNSDVELKTPYNNVNRLPQYGATGLPVIRNNVEIIGQGGNNITIARSDTNEPFRIFEVESGSTVVFKNLTITGGFAPEKGGGAILARGSEIIIDQSIITTNGTVFLGGGIFIEEGGQLTVRNSTITSNFSAGTIGNSDGGGIAVVNSELNIVTSDFRGNNADGNGNALYVFNPILLSDGTTPSRLTDNCIVSNGNGVDVHVESDNNAQFVAIRNWWGVPSGPNTGGDTITSVDVITDTSVHRVSEPQAFMLTTGETLLGCTEPYNIRFTDDGTTTWEDDQIKNIVSGVRTTGQALMQLLADEGVTNADAFSPEEAFNRVIVDHVDNVFDGYVLFVKTTNSGIITIATPSGTDLVIGPIGTACFAQTGDQENNIPQAVACNNFEADLHPIQTVVHEIGHLFDYKTASDGGLSLMMGLNEPQALIACNGDIIWGENSNSSITWTRGEDGWGSGPSRTTLNQKLFTMFQRNPTFYDQGTGKNNEEILEAAADTFLNWIYRYIDDPDNGEIDFNCPVSGIDPDHWQDDPSTPDIETFASGFLNRIWSGTSSDNATNGNRDNELKGDIRYVRAHKNIKALIQEGGY